MAAKSRLGSVCSPWWSIWSPSTALIALTKVKFTPMPLMSRIWSSGCPVDMGEQIGRFTASRCIREHFYTFDLLFVLEDLVGQGFWPAWVAVAWAARIHLVISYGDPLRGAFSCALPPLRLNAAATIAFLFFFDSPLYAAETGTAACAILTSRIVSSIMQLSLPSAFLSNRSRRRPRPSPASAADRNLDVDFVGEVMARTIVGIAAARRACVRSLVRVLCVVRVVKVAELVLQLLSIVHDG
eukprot:6190571-Pleurochrysis_carterae.AAC.1